MPSKKQLRLLLTLVLIAFTIGAWFFDITFPGSETTPPLPSNLPALVNTALPTNVLSATTSTDASTSANVFLVTRVIDGDTVELSTGQIVRYIGIDTPETKDPRKGVECFGPEAAQKNQELVLNQWVTLEKDVSETDRYGRLLRYVYVNNQLVNQVLIREGFAQASSYPPDIKNVEVFREAQVLAQKEEKGLWGALCAPNVASP